MSVFLSSSSSDNLDSLGDVTGFATASAGIPFAFIKPALGAPYHPVAASSSVSVDPDGGLEQGGAPSYSLRIKPDSTTTSDSGLRFTTDGVSVSGRVKITGDTMQGTLNVPLNPSGETAAVPKRYVDDLDTVFLKIFGGTMKGPLNIIPNPSDDSEAVPKKYVDDAVVGALALDPEGGIERVSDLVRIKLNPGSGAQSGLELGSDGMKVVGRVDKSGDTMVGALNVIVPSSGAIRDNAMPKWWIEDYVQTHSAGGKVQKLAAIQDSITTQLDAMNSYLPYSSYIKLDSNVTGDVDAGEIHAAMFSDIDQVGPGFSLNSFKLVMTNIESFQLVVATKYTIGDNSGTVMSISMGSQEGHHVFTKDYPLPVDVTDQEISMGIYSKPGPGTYMFTIAYSYDIHVASQTFTFKNLPL